MSCLIQIYNSTYRSLYNRIFNGEILHYRLPRKFFKFSRNDIKPPPRHCEQSEAIHNLITINFHNGIFNGKILHYGLLYCFMPRKDKWKHRQSGGIRHFRHFFLIVPAHTHALAKAKARLYPPRFPTISSTSPMI
ncbi:hypothetical protein [Helicobacter rodentium]|uniref:hypothetical protein n=1 Tax=Helicobacter rodentium TaxID=59617 RepID=UPI002558089F|nr:hypothetical protein [Helicobacter rodentium]